MRCVAASPSAGRAGVGLFALDIGDVAERGLDFDRVVRRFGAGRAVWSEPATIGGDLVGVCFTADLATQRCVVLWHRDGLVIGLDLTLPAEVTDTLEAVSSTWATDALAGLVPEVVETLIVGLPTTTSTTSTTSSTSSTTLDDVDHVDDLDDHVGAVDHDDHDASRRRPDDRRRRRPSRRPRPTIDDGAVDDHDHDD